jgi:hypothetical protein
LLFREQHDLLTIGGNSAIGAVLGSILGDVSGVAVAGAGWLVFGADLVVLFGPFLAITASVSPAGSSRIGLEAKEGVIAGANDDGVANSNDGIDDVAVVTVVAVVLAGDDVEVMGCLSFGGLFTSESGTEEGAPACWARNRAMMGSATSDGWFLRIDAIHLSRGSNRCLFLNASSLPYQSPRHSSATHGSNCGGQYFTLRSLINDRLRRH